MDYNILNGPLRWQMSTSIKLKHEHFSLDLMVFEIFTFQNSWHWKCRSRSWHTAYAVSLFKGKHQTSYMMVIIMLALSLREMRKWRKIPIFVLKMKVKFKERHSTRNAWILIEEFLFKNVCYLEHMFTDKDSHTQTKTHREKGVITTGKICEADLPKKQY